MKASGLGRCSVAELGTEAGRFDLEESKER